LSSVVSEGGSVLSISVLVPVLGRPQNARPVLESLRSTSDAELVFIVTANDLEELDACRMAVTLDRGSSRTLVVEEWRSHDYPKKMNHAYGETISDWVLLGSDDITFEPGWQDELLRAARATGKSVIGTNDKANRLVMKGIFSTHALVSRAYVEEQGGCLEGPGHLVSEVYEHNFPDRELAALAQSRDEWVFAPRAVIRHRHPAFGTAPQDATYEKGREHFLEDQARFWERAEQWGNVGLIPQELQVKDRSKKRTARLAATARARRERGT
jgi:hypothetical protein